MADVVTHLSWSICKKETQHGTTDPLCALV